MCVSTLFAVEMADVYKQWGAYRYIEIPGLRVYFPEKIKDSMPRIITSFSKVREKVVENFEKEKNFVVTVILDEHDDVIDSTADSKFDFIKLGIFDEMDTLSARSYSLEKRFALSLSKTLLKHSTSNASFEWRRAIAMLLMPHWFVEGSALNYAFPIDSIHYSRLLDMARCNRLYSLDDLNTITSQSTLVKEEMLFQAHSMLAYWESTLKKGADLKLMASILRKPVGFETAFKQHYGVNLRDAYESYVKYVSEQSKDFADYKEPDILDVDCISADDKIFRSYTRISDDERIWVSSKRYTTENYDLYYRKGIQKPVILLKNVHPAMIYDEQNKEVIIGCYYVNGRREKRLALWKVTLDGRARCVSSKSGSFKPLAIKDNRIYFVQNSLGVVSVVSVNCNELNSEKTELMFDASVRPLDVALDIDNNRLFYTMQTTEFETKLFVVSLDAKNIKDASKEITEYDGDIRSLKIIDGKLWCACDSDHSTTQLFCYDEKNSLLRKYSSLSGGVWDISITDPAKKSIEVTTLYDGGFVVATLPFKEIEDESMEVTTKPNVSYEDLLDVKSHKYRTEYSTSLWKPALGKDASGKVIGLYNQRTDRLGRTSIVIAPTYGLKSHKWGYTSTFMKRFDQLRTELSFNDYTIEKSYMDNDYYERVKSRKLNFVYPMRLDMELYFGLDLAKRNVAKNKGGRITPTEGKDHNYYVGIKQESIRNEPYSNIFPRKGRIVDFKFTKGADTIFGGDLIYKSTSLKWTEFIPVSDAYVFTLSGWIAQDDKKNDIRRPDDLSLGGDFYMRAYGGSYKSGDKLRYASASLARPIRIELPKQISWVRNEFSSLGVFWEIGDTINTGKFNYIYDRGVEFTSKILLFKRIPLSMVAGYALRNGEDGHGSYCNFYLQDLEELIR